MDCDGHLGASLRRREWVAVRDSPSGARQGGGFGSQPVAAISCVRYRALRRSTPVRCGDVEIRRLRRIRASPSRRSFSRLFRQAGAPVGRGGFGRLGSGGCAVWVSVHASGELGLHRDFATPRLGAVFRVASAARRPVLRHRSNRDYGASARYSRRGIIVRATDFHFIVRSASTTCFGRRGEQAARPRSGGPRPRSGREREVKLEVSACSIDARRFGAALAMTEIMLSAGIRRFSQRLARGDASASQHGSRWLRPQRHELSSPSGGKEGRVTPVLGTGGL